MGNRWITVETISLIFIILTGWILNGCSLFMDYWYFEEGFRIPSSSFGIIPINPELPTFFLATAIMMIISFSSFCILGAFFTFALVTFMIHKYKMTRLGYLIVSILSGIIFLLQLSSFIVMTICLKYADSHWNLHEVLPTIGACEYLALISSFFNIITIPIAVHLSRTDFK